MRTFLPERNALAACDMDDLEAIIVGAREQTPLLSITIPTFKRTEFLIEAVRCALGQDFDRPFEVVVVDDDPASKAYEALAAAIPGLAAANFLYLRARKNGGMFANINRCVMSARGEWLTILHDDDLIDPNFAREMMRKLDGDPRIDGLVCEKRCVDHRAVPIRIGPMRHWASRLLKLYRFGVRTTRRVEGRNLFWGCTTGNTVGFICRASAARAVGGFHAEEHPASDYFFYARFADRFHLAETGQSLATIRIADNSLMKTEAQLACLRLGYELQRAYAGTVLPRFWRRFSPLLMARQVANTSRVWRSDLSPEKVGEMLGIRIPRDRPLLLFTIRGLLRGF